MIRSCFVNHPFFCVRTVGILIQAHNCIDTLSENYIKHYLLIDF